MSLFWFDLIVLFYMDSLKKTRRHWSGKQIPFDSPVSLENIYILGMA